MSAPTEPPLYKGEPLDAERGPGLGCFWIQVGLLVFFLLFTPLTVMWAWDPFISGALLIFTLILLLFTGQTIIFLLRLVAADRRTQRTPLARTASPTVGQIVAAEVPPVGGDAATPIGEASAPGTATVGATAAPGTTQGPPQGHPRSVRTATDSTPPAELPPDADPR